MPRDPRTALITGVAGQDGVYLARHLSETGRRVVGTVTPGSATPAARQVYLDGVALVELHVQDARGFRDLLDAWQPAEVYNLAALSSVGASWDRVEELAEVNATAVLRMLDGILRHRDRHGVAPRFYQASTSEVFGAGDRSPYDELCAHAPANPYGATKSFAHHLVRLYREKHDLFACAGILFNHESPLRSSGFVSRKICRAAAEIAVGRADHVTLGNLDVRRDWGAAQDYVRSMPLMLQQEVPSDYVIASGTSHALSDLLDVAFDAAGLGPAAPYVRQDPSLMRTAEVADRRGDITRARNELGWSPTVTFADMIGHMVRVDISRLQNGREEDVAYLDQDAPAGLGPSGAATT